MSARSPMHGEVRRPEPITVPPPKGARDAYSATTRVGTLPEDVLLAMRDRETDAALAARTRSGTRRAVRIPLPPPLPAAARSSPVQSFAPIPVPTISSSYEDPVPKPIEPLQEALPSGPWLAPSVPEELIEDFEPQSGLARSVVIVAVFAALGGLVAAAITFW